MKNIIVLLVSLTIGITEVGAQTPYFQGKTIRFIVGYRQGARMTCGRASSDRT
jgi:hypothetical protein